MADEQLVEALRVLGPASRLPGQLLFAESAAEAAGIALADLEQWAASHGGGRIEAGAVKLRQGQRPEQGKVGRPEAFVIVPESALD